MPQSPSANVEKNVFINCPFDDEYRPLLEPPLFTLVFLGFTPPNARLALSNGRSLFLLNFETFGATVLLHFIDRSFFPGVRPT
jgi:hypothetical protein